MAVSTEAQGATKRSGETTEVEFYFDVVCPWAWRTSLWIREVAKVRPITRCWKFLSLEMINTTRPGGQVKESHLVSRLLLEVGAIELPIPTEGPQRRSIGQIIEIGDQYDAQHGTRLGAAMWQIVEAYEQDGLRLAGVEPDSAQVL